MSEAGLDQYLFRVEKGAKPELGPYPDTPVFNSDDPEDRSGWAARNEIGYWRKANQIHRWFVDECGGGVDECQPILVNSEVLPVLYEQCKKVLADHSLAQQLLPTRSGFFFGGTEYDDWYFADLEYTVQMIEEKVINDPETRNCDIYYQASW